MQKRTSRQQWCLEPVQSSDMLYLVTVVTATSVRTRCTEAQGNSMPRPVHDEVNEDGQPVVVQNDQALYRLR